MGSQEFDQFIVMIQMKYQWGNEKLQRILETFLLKRTFNEKLLFITKMSFTF